MKNKSHLILLTCWLTLVGGGSKKHFGHFGQIRMKKPFTKGLCQVCLLLLHFWQTCCSKVVNIQYVLKRTQGTSLLKLKTGSMISLKIKRLYVLVDHQFSKTFPCKKKSIWTTENIFLTNDLFFWRMDEILDTMINNHLITHWVMLWLRIAAVDDGLRQWRWRWWCSGSGVEVQMGG